MKIVITAPFHQEQVEELRREHTVFFQPQAEDVPLRNEAQLHELLEREHAEVLICESDVVTAGVLEGLDGLTLLCVCRAGLNDIDVEACTKRHIAVVNAPGRNAAAVADMVVALFISMSRFLSEGERLLRAGKWDDGLYYRLRGRELHDNTAAFVGFGAIPKELSRRLAGFNMQMIAYDPFVSEKAMAAYKVRKVTLEEAFSQGDFVTVHLPVTESTRGLVDARLLNMMKSDAYFVNAARSAIVREADIIQVLREHRIAGAAFDVYEQEPLPLDSPVLTLDHVILIPHLGGASVDVVKNHSRMITAEIQRYCAGEHPVHLVNPTVMA